ncbi:MAG: endonuclease V [Candidatus Pacearchaeota archaeon]|jgi:deoxyribonuclease V
MEKNIIREKEFEKKFNINLEELKKEQIKLAKGLEIKDKIDFNLADRFGAVDTTFIGNKILCSIIVCNKEFEVIDRAYVYDKVKFPYIPSFRNYREIPAMMEAFEKLNERPDIIFVSAQGITHQRLGLASHFGLTTGIPTIGISDTIVECEVDNQDILKNGKKVGKLLVIKEGSRPMYISPGNNISIEKAVELSKNLIKLPHKHPEPMHLASKYSREVQKELAQV